MTDTKEDERCCGTGTCVIDARGRCWCGQQWDGTTMCKPEATSPATFDGSAAGTAPQKAS